MPKRIAPYGRGIFSLTAFRWYVLCLFVLFVPSLSFAESFALIMGNLGRVVARRGGAPVWEPFVALIYGRLSRLAVRFARLAARVQAGVLPRAAGVRADSERIRPVAVRLPRGFGWLIRMMPEAAVYGSQLRHLLSEPGMVALLAAAPQAGRLLRPLCRMLGVEEAAELLPPAPARRKAAEPQAPRADAAKPIRRLASWRRPVVKPA